MHELELEAANLDAYGVDGADQRAAEAEQAWAAGDTAVAALGDLPPGPRLAQALEATAGFALRPRARIQLVGHWERQRAWTDAQAMAALTAAASSTDDDATRSVIADTARTMKVSEYSVGTRLGLARHVAAGLDGTWTALNDGAITPAHLWVLATVTRDCTPRLTAAVEGQVLAKAIARGWTPTQLADAARTAVVKLDPAGAEQRARDAKKQRSDVILRPDEDQMATLVAHTDAFTGRQAMDEINRRADQLQRHGDQRSLGERRMAALANALLGDQATHDTASHDTADDATDDPADAEPAAASAPRAGSTHQPKRATALLLITLPTLLGGDQPGYLDGYGPITAGLARRIAASDIRFRRLLLDPHTGAPLHLSADSYQLSPRLRRWIDARDRTCRFPGCRRRAAHCDADHAIEWPHGPTSDSNCGLLCRTHHNLKTTKNWQLTRNPDNSLDWQSPHGLTWHTEPATYEEFLDADPPPEPLEETG